MAPVVVSGLLVVKSLEPETFTKSYAALEARKTFRALYDAACKIVNDKACPCGPDTAFTAPMAQEARLEVASQPWSLPNDGVRSQCSDPPDEVGLEMDTGHINDLIGVDQSYSWLIDEMFEHVC